MALKVKLPGGFRIENDFYQLILIEQIKVKSPKAKKKFTERKYYVPNMKIALKTYASLSLMHDEDIITSVEEYINKLNQIYDSAAELLKNEMR
jgi:hypothetical protein